MNILIVTDRTKNIKEIFIKHVEEWAKFNNDIYMLNSRENSDDNTKNINFIKTPSYSSNKLLLSLWFYLINHPRVDIVINKFSTLPFIVPHSNNVIYLNEVPKNTLISRLLLKFLYENNYFLTENVGIRNYLIKNEIKSQKIFVLEKAMQLTTKKPNKGSLFSKSLLFVESDSSKTSWKTAIEVFEKIERRQEGWKYRLLVGKESYELVKDTISKLESPAHYTVISKNRGSSLAKDFAKSEVLVDVDASSESLVINAHAIYSGLYVLGYKNGSITDFPGIEKVILNPIKNDPQTLANLIMDFSTNPTLERKIKQGILNFLSLYSWSNLARRSLAFLESI